MVQYSNEEIVKMYFQMAFGRIYQEIILERLTQGKMTKGFYHLSIGVESVATGILNAMGPDDYVLPNHRQHSLILAKLDPKLFTAELMGRTTGYQSGGQWKIPMVIRAPQGAGVCAGEIHSQCVEGWFQNIPGLKIVVPSTPADALGLLKTSIRDDDPVLFLEHKALMGMRGEVPDGDYTIPLGEANIVREGKDVTILTYQVMLRHAIAAAADLAAKGIDVEIVDLRTLWPFDYKTIAASVAKTGRVLIVHESPLRGGVGGEIAAFIADECFSDLKAPIKRLGGADCFIPFNEAELFCFPNKDKIKSAVMGIVGEVS